MTQLKWECIIIFKQYFMRNVILRTMIISLLLLKGLLKTSIEFPEYCSGNKSLALGPSEN